MTAKTTLAATIAIALLATAGASAGEHGKHGMRGGFDHFAKADANGDGAVSKDEMTAALQAHFGKYDANKDGKIVLGELPKEMPVPEEAKAKMQEHYDRMVEKRGKEKADKMMERASKGQSRIDFMSRFDRDNDEAISFAEFSAKPLKHFEKADGNGDGTVTAAEKEEAMKKMREHMKERGHGKWGKRGDDEKDPE
ncbi:hypothetical protein [Gimibacter soli]|uniref:EF-hand domain-containing protein n=1 Tax=Gimibacter soli TaxID=3024400 RepID=A0AAF0BN91_9PROT|nr:hypothetical protein [Gimibacter soli]WCL55725.1 hypothetical protein PH603_08145 [Gimibacter soli]